MPAEPERQDEPEPQVVHRPDIQRMVAALLLILEQGRQQARERAAERKPRELGDASA